MEANATTEAPKKRGRPKGSKNKTSTAPGGVPPYMQEAQKQMSRVCNEGAVEARPAPRLGTHDAAKELIRLIAKQYPNAGPMEWRQVLATLNAAARHPKLWIELTRGD